MSEPDDTCVCKTTELNEDSSCKTAEFNEACSFNTIELKKASSHKKPDFGEAIRSEFLMRKDCVFVNHGSYGAVPRCVHRRKIAYLEEMESHPDVWYRYSLETYLPETVEKVANFIGVNACDTFLMSNVTKAVNTVLKSCPTSPDGAFLITNLTYSSVKMATSHTSSCRGCPVRMFSIDFPIQSEEKLTQDYEEFLIYHPEIQLAIIDHITSPSAVVLPVKLLTEISHRHGVLVMIDGAHAPGQLELDLPDIDADFYAGNLHKWVYAPSGCAFLWMNPLRNHSWLRPLITAYYHGKSLQAEFLFEGTNDDTSLLCASAAIDFYKSLGGIEVITQYTSNLREAAVSYLETAWGTQRLDVPASMVAPNIQMVQLPQIPKYSDNPGRFEELQKFIVEFYDIQTYINVIKDKLYLRVSTQVYNEFKDYVKLAEAVLHLCLEE